MLSIVMGWNIEIVQKTGNKNIVKKLYRKMLLIVDQNLKNNLLLGQNPVTFLKIKLMHVYFSTNFRRKCCNIIKCSFIVV